MVPLEGPVGVGALIDAVMLGCLIVQSCVYYKNSRASAWLLSVLVSLILFLLLSHLSCMAVWLWASGQANTGDAPVADYAAILFGVSNVFGAVILFFERCFFTHRILQVSQNHLLTFVFLVFCIFSFTAALGAASVFFTNGTADLTSQLSGGWMFPLAILSGVVCDLAISIATALCLRYQTPIEVADVLGRAARLFLLIAETGSVTSFFGVVIVVVYWLTRSNFAWVGLLVCMPGVFANTFLASLNARKQLCADIEHRRAVKTSDPLTLIDSRCKKPPIMIAISKQVEKRSDKSPV